MRDNPICVDGSRSSLPELCDRTVEPALADYRAAISKATGLIGLIENIPLRQRGPRSAVPVLDISVAAIVELWFANEDLRARGMTNTDQTPSIHTYPVTEHRFM